MALCVTVARSRGRMHFSNTLLPVVLLLPLWGPACAIAGEMHIRGGEKGDEEPGARRFDITDEVYRSIRMDKDDMSDVVPIEDVLEDGTPLQRRHLLLSVLHEDPGQFVRPLRIAGVNDDTEVVHYAVTALVELRSEYTQRIAQMEALYQKQSSNTTVIQDYVDLDEEYLNSGIPDSTEREERIAHCRGLLEKLLYYTAWQETGGRGMASSQDGGPARRRELHRRIAMLLKRLGNICLQQGDTAAAEDAGRRLMKELPDKEDGYMLVLRAKAAARDSRGVAEVIRTVRRREIFLSPEAREQIEFWSA